MGERPVTLDHQAARTAVLFDPGVGRADLCILRSFLDPQPAESADPNAARIAYPCPYGSHGDILWARDYTRSEDGKLLYGSDYDFGLGRGWKAPSRMPRKLARMFLRVASTRLAFERVGQCATPVWFWEAGVEVVRNALGKLCSPGPEAVWKGSFHSALMSADGVTPRSAENVVQSTLRPLISAKDWSAVNDHLLTFAHSWMRSAQVGLALTEFVKALVRPCRQNILEGWSALREKEMWEKKASKW